MHKSFYFVGDIFIFLVFICLIVDISSLRIAKENLKDSLDLATKAAVLQVDTTEEKIAKGIFEIDNIKAKVAFLDIMEKNINLDKESIKLLMLDYRAINAPGKYLNPADNKEYTITYPTFVAPMKFKFKGILLNKEIMLSNNFAGSQLINRVQAGIQ